MRRFTPNPILYIVILSCGLLIPFGFELRHHSVFNCPADGYGSNHYLAYCHVEMYGDYDHSAFWFDLEPDIVRFARDADVMFLGNSRMQFGFSSQATRDWFSSANNHYFLLGFSSDENMTFAAPILSKIQPQAKVYIINVDRFFEDRETAIGREILRDKDAQRRAKEKHFWQALHKQICTTLSVACGTKTSFFRLRETGEWNLKGSRDWSAAPVTIGSPSDSELWDEYAVLGEQFISRLPVDRRCVVLTIVPSEKTKLAEAMAIASALKLDLFAPQLDGLQTFDQSHLDRPSAERWSHGFFQIAGPRIRECLGNVPRLSSE